jgi:N-acetyl sugar amidotransferase
MSNQRPASAIEFKHKRDSKKITLNFDENNVCDACKTAEHKEAINWENRERELLLLLDKYRSSDGSYDCLVPGSGGKDSAYQAHVLKYKYGMNPLTVTWPPILYTDYGYQNWKNWIDSGFDNISFNRNGKTMKLLTKLSIENLFHPFQTFILGQKNLAPKIASKYGIPLIFYGENEAEYGNPIADNSSSLRDKSYFSYQNINEVYLGGVSIKELKEKYNVPLNDLLSFLPAQASELESSKIEVHYLGYYLKWTPQEVYYYAVENTGFKARPFRTQGTYSKYNSIDDKIDDNNQKIDQLQGKTEVIEEQFRGDPPNVLLLKRKAIRMYPNSTRIALYYNDRLNKYFSIPYSTEENISAPIQAEEVKLDEAVHGVEQLRKIVDSKQHGVVKHRDGSASKIDHHTASAILAVHDKLNDDNKKKINNMVSASKYHIQKVANFAYSKTK